MLEQLEQDLKNVVSALEQSLANHNFLIGQKQTLETVIARIKQGVDTAASTVDSVEKVVDATATAASDATTTDATQAVSQ